MFQIQSKLKVPTHFIACRMLSNSATPSAEASDNAAVSGNNSDEPMTDATSGSQEVAASPPSPAPPTPTARDLRRSGRSRGRSCGGPSDDRLAGHRINGVEYRIGDCCYAEEPGRSDEPYIIGQLEELRVSRREAASVRLRVFCRTQDVPDAAYEAQGCREQMFANDPERQEEARLRELFLSETRESLPAACLRGRCRVERYPDLDAASAGYRLRPDAFFCVFAYNPETPRLASTLAEIRVGPAYQAHLPDCRAEVPSMHPLADESGRVWETTRWRPGQLEDEELRMYIRAARSLAAFAGFCDLGSAREGQASADNDRTAQRALDTLHDLDYDVRLALRVLVRNPRLSVVASVGNGGGTGGGALDEGESGAPWSRDCVRRFQKGVRQYGKNFWRIRRELLPDRRVGQLVHFYYLWKRSSACPNGSRSAGRRSWGATSPAIAQIEPACRNCEECPAAGDGDPLCGECRLFYLKYGEDRPSRGGRVGVTDDVEQTSIDAKAATDTIVEISDADGDNSDDSDSEDSSSSSCSSSSGSSGSNSSTSDDATVPSNEPPNTSLETHSHASPSPPKPSRPTPAYSPTPLHCRLPADHISSSGRRDFQRVWIRSGGRNSCARTDLQYQAPPVATSNSVNSVTASSPVSQLPLNRPMQSQPAAASAASLAAEEQHQKMLAAAAWQAERSRLTELALLHATGRPPPTPTYLTPHAPTQNHSVPPPYALMMPPPPPHQPAPSSSHSFSCHAALNPDHLFAAISRHSMTPQPPQSPLYQHHHQLRHQQPPPELAPLFAAAAAAAAQQQHQQQLQQGLAQRQQQYLLQQQFMSDPRCYLFDPAFLAGADPRSLQFPPLPPR